MPTYHFKKIDKEGKKIEGTMEASDKFALYHQIKEDGSTVIYAEEEKKKKNIALFNALPFFNSVKVHDKIIFARNLSKMLDAGLPITRSLSIIEREASGEFKKVVSKL